MGVKDILNIATRLLTENSTTLLTSAAVGGVVSTGILAARGAVTAEREWRAYVDTLPLDAEEPPVKERIARTWTHYIPAVVVAGTSVACVIGAHSIHNRRNAAILSAYTISEKAFGEYRDRVIEEIGSSKETDIRDAIVTDKVQENPPVQSEIIIAGSGETLCYDTLTGRYFMSDMETIRRAQNDINARVINEAYCSQNEFYSMIGLTPVELGEELGWQTSHMMDLNFTSVLSDNGKPCLAIDYRVNPIKNYYKVW